MLRRVPWRLVRRKHAQKAWSPNNTSGGGAPTNGITAQEALQIAYRPMPPTNTVEYEEDFGPSMMIHREFVSSKHRAQMSMDISALAYSDVELVRARQQLSNAMNRERRGVLVGDGGEERDRVFFNSDVDETTREVKSARFLFNEPRMQFCDRFQTFFRDRIERQQERVSGSSDGVGEDRHYYFSLMEACAVLHGCETAAAREVYYRRFLGLDLDTLEEEDAAVRARAADAAEVSARLAPMAAKGDSSSTSTSTSSGGGGAAVVSAAGTRDAADALQDVIDALPPLFPPSPAASAPTVVSGDDGAADEAWPGAHGEDGPPRTPLLDEGAASDNHLAEDVAPLFKAYLAHARGESPVGSYDVTTVGSHAVHATRRRWRSLMDKIAAEDYHQLSAAELEDAYALNNQLHTVKFFDLKVGDTVREIMQLLQRETGSSASGNRDTPVAMSPTHPERRV